jgi:hypothetical protein
MNPKFRYHIHVKPPLIPILRQMNQVHIMPSYFKIQFNNIFQSMPISPYWSLSFVFSSFH